MDRRKFRFTTAHGRDVPYMRCAIVIGMDPGRVGCVFVSLCRGDWWVARGVGCVGRASMCRVVSSHVTSSYVVDMSRCQKSLTLVVDSG